MTDAVWRAAAAALLAGMAVSGYYAVNTGFGGWDDEGFVLLSLPENQ